MTKQEVFTQVVTRQREQLRAGYDPEANACSFYRTPDGFGCAVGCLLEEHEYDRSMEGRQVHQIMLPSRLKFHGILLAELQEIHDHLMATDWHAHWETLAKRWHLEMPK